MNVTDYLLEKSHLLDKNFLVGVQWVISYKNLCKKVNILSAHIYKKFGTGKEFILLSQNNAFFIISYLAIIKSGNVAILLETRVTDNDLEYIIDKCSIGGVFIHSKFISKLDKFIHNPTINKNVFTETALDNLPEDESKISIINNGDDVALIIFTSGSTGGKKGVMLTHKNIIANTESIVEYLGIKENDRMEVVLPFFYSYGLSLLNTHLRVGGSMVLNQGIFLGSVINEIMQYECTGFAGVPSTYQILINKTDFLEQDFSGLKYLTQAGGKLADKFISRITKAFPQKLFFVMYGATEATARLSYLPPQLVNKKMGSIGKGIPNVILEVLDIEGRPVKPEEIGEIVAKGDNVMKGYYKDPEATNKVLKNGKFYTGDLATIDKDGFIYITGRSNEMIKSAGYRIFPNEIEGVVSSVEHVLDCIVFGLPDDIMGEAIVASVLVKVASEELRTEILSHCNKVLPSYKIPKYVLFFDDFPLNSSNKVHRAKIKEIASSKIR